MDEQGKQINHRKVAVLVITLLSCCVGLVLFGDYPKNGIRVKRLEADLNEQLPYGSTWEQAEAWFASHGLQPVGIYGDVDNQPQQVGLMAIVPNDSFLESAKIYITVEFSPEGRLIERWIHRRAS